MEHTNEVIKKINDAIKRLEADVAKIKEHIAICKEHEKQGKCEAHKQSEQCKSCK